MYIIKNIVFVEFVFKMIYTKKDKSGILEENIIEVLDKYDFDGVHSLKLSVKQ